MDGFIQIGVTAARDPATGAFLPAVPLYIEATDAAAKSADGLIEDIQSLFAARFAAYMDATEAAGVAVPDPGKAGFMRGIGLASFFLALSIRLASAANRRSERERRCAVRFRAPAPYAGRQIYLKGGAHYDKERTA